MQAIQPHSCYAELVNQSANTERQRAQGWASADVFVQGMNMIKSIRGSEVTPVEAELGHSPRQEDKVEEREWRQAIQPLAPHIHKDTDNWHQSSRWLQEQGQKKLPNV